MLPTFGVRVGIRLLPFKLANVFACAGEPYILLGRDVLNHFRVVLDGPKLALEIDA